MAALGLLCRWAMVTVLSAYLGRAVKWEEPLGPSELPSSGFPGASVAESNAAFPRGVQPKSLAAWPRQEDGSLAPCWKRTTVRDSAAHWPGRCLGLTLVPGVTTLNECAARCSENTLCPMWQVTHQGECYQGLGTNCESREGDLSFDIQGAARILHGDVTVVQSMKKYEVANLRTIGIFNVGNGSDGVQRCRSLCYSNIKCTLWQYGADGCRVQDDEFLGVLMQYPMTTLDGGADSTSEVARTMRDSEYIQHHCPPIPAGAVNVDNQAGMRTPAPTHLADALKAWWWWLLGAFVLTLGLLICLCCLFMQACGKKKRETKRGLIMHESAEFLTYSRESLDESDSEGETATPLVQSPATVLRPNHDSLGSFTSDYNGSIVAPMQHMPLSPGGSSASFGFGAPPLRIPNVSTGSFNGNEPNAAMRLMTASPPPSSAGSFAGNLGGGGAAVRYL